jgi:hypothetical protein
MDDPLLVRLFERLGNLQRNGKAFIEGERHMLQALCQSRTFDQLHDQRARLAARFEPVDLGDARVIQLREELCFALETREPLLFNAITEELLAESATRFFSRTTDGQIEFEQDAQGVVTGLILHLDGEKHSAKRLEERVEVKLPPEVLSRYAGAYRFETGLDVVMTVEDGRLRVKPGDQPEDTLYAEAEDRFFSKTFNAQVEFTRNKDGQTTGLIFHNGGEHTRATRRANR